MKKISIAAFLLLSFAIDANAQHRKCGNENGKHGKKMHQEFGAKLNLTEEQKGKSKALHTEYKSKMEALKANKSITVGEMEKQRAAIQEDRKKKVDAILTPEQKKQMETAKQFKGGKQHGKHGKKHAGFKKDLNLTDQQMAVLKTNKENVRKQREMIQNDKTLTPDQQKSKMKELKEKNKQSFMQTLTPEQQEKMKNMPKKGREHKPNVK